MQSTQLVASAAQKPTVLKDSSVPLVMSSPNITGISEAMTGPEVFSPRINHANITVKSGAEALIASTKDAATCCKLTSPKTTVAARIRPTRHRLRRKLMRRRSFATLEASDDAIDNDDVACRSFDP